MRGREQMVANCEVLVCQYSTLAFVGLALGKEVHSYYPREQLQRLLPLQGGMAAQRIAEVCRGLLAERRDRVRAPSRMVARLSPG